MNPAYQYCLDVISKKTPAPKYVIKQCRDMRKVFEGKHKLFVFDNDEYEVVKSLLKLMNMSSGFKAGETVYSSLVGFQWLFIEAVFCVKDKKDIKKRGYESAVLLIGRKSGKTFLIAVIFVLLMLLEPDYAELYSVAANGDLSRIVKKEIDQLIACSPLIRSHFKVLGQSVECLINHNVYKPLNYSRNLLDGRKSNAWLADEVGALPERYAISAMSSSQINMKNRMGIIISTAYPSKDNPMIEEVEYSKEVLDGKKDNVARFSLIYEPDDKKRWKTNDEIIFHSNPLALEVPENLEYLYKQRQVAIDMPSERTNFLTKHLNIFLDKHLEVSYLPLDVLRKCAVDKVDFEGKGVVVGMDLSMTTDLTAVSIMYKEDGIYYFKAMGFLPEDSLAKRGEKFDYRAAESQGECIITEGGIVDYDTVENYIRNIEEEFGCEITAIIADPFNVTQMAQSLAQDYDVVLFRQSYFNLSAPTKEFRAAVHEGNVVYERSSLLEWCFANAVTKKDTKENEIIEKGAKGRERVDLASATIFAFAEVMKQDDFCVQVI